MRTLSAAEVRVVEHVSARTEDAIALLQRAVDINSGTLNHAGVRAVGELFGAELEALGFGVRWAELPEALNRAGHLVAERIGDGGGSRLLLIGHLDTVYEAHSPFQRFRRLDERTATGPGVIDMKGGDVAMLFALRALRDEGALDGATVRVILTGDEEGAGRPLAISRAALLDAARESDLALGFEPGSRDDGNEYAVVGRRSSHDWLLRTTGVTAHSSVILSDAVGAGAVFEAARILSAFYDQVSAGDGLTLNPAVALGGGELRYDTHESRGDVCGKPNVVAGTALVNGDLRVLSLEQLARAQERMREIVAASLPGTSAEIEFGEGYPPMTPTPRNHALLEMLSDANEALIGSPVLAADPTRRGAADISFVSPLVDGLDGLGPLGSGMHSSAETIDLGSYGRVIARAAVLMSRLVAAKRTPAAAGA